MLGLELDHLVVGAASLEAGVAHVADALGVPPTAFSPVGRHALMGTHNRLLNLSGGQGGGGAISRSGGDVNSSPASASAAGPGQRDGCASSAGGRGGGCYLEVIAVDPSAPPPGRPRWFGLDDPATQARLAERPRLLHWVARLRAPADLRQLAEAGAGHLPQGLALPPVLAMQRGDFRWRIAVPADGSLPSWRTEGGRPGAGADGGVFPTLIQWDVPQSPAQVLPASGLELRRLTGTHPEAEALRAALQELGAGGLLQVEAGEEAGLAAEIGTPAGVRLLA